MRKVNYSSLIPIALFALLTTLIILPACNYQEDPPAEANQSDLLNQGRFHVPDNWDGNLTIYVSNDKKMELNALLGIVFQGADPAQARPAIGLLTAPHGVRMEKTLQVKEEFEAIYGEVGSARVLPAPGQETIDVIIDEKLDPERGLMDPAILDDPDPIDICQNANCSVLDSQRVTIAQVGGYVFTGNCSNTDVQILINQAIYDCTNGRISSYNRRCPDPCVCHPNVTSQSSFQVTCLQPGQTRSWTFGSCTLTITGPLVFNVTVYYRTGPCRPPSNDAN